MTRCAPFLIAAALVCVAGGDSLAEDQRLSVTASAFNSLPDQTDDTPRLTAWGDRLEPGMRVIAISRDLLDMGLSHRTHVTIDELPGTYHVLDKMGPRWTRKIDIYMGVDVDAALDWGVRPVTIRWVDDTSAD